MSSTSSWIFCAGLGLSVCISGCNVQGGTTETDSVYLQMSALSACTGFGSPEVMVEVNDPALTTATGLAVGQINSSLLWTHNQDGEDPQFLILNADGEVRATLTLDGVSPQAIEDMAIGIRPDGNAWLFAADIGDSGETRRTVQIYGFREPSVDFSIYTDALSITPETLEVTYPEGPVDASTLLYDPIYDVLFIVTRTDRGATRLYEITIPSTFASTVTAREVAAVQIVQDTSEDAIEITGGDISIDGSGVLLRTRTHVFFWRRTNQKLAYLFTEDPCSGPLADEPAGEAIAFSDDSYLTLSQGTYQPIYFYQRTAY